MSKLLRKALKSAILPASLLVAGKFLSVFLLISYTGLQFFVRNDNSSFFTIQLYLTDPNATLFVNSFSNLISLLLVAVPALYQLLQLILLEKAQGNPRVIVKLTKLNLLKWVTSQESSLVKVVVWTVFLWIISGIVISSSINSSTYAWIGIFAGFVAMISTWGLLKTFESETAKIYPDEGQRYL